MLTGLTLTGVLPVLVGIAVAAWLALVAAALGSRLVGGRRRRRLDTAVTVGSVRERHLVAVLDDRDGHRPDAERARALTTLGRSDHPDSREFFERALRSGDEELRRAAVAGLGQLGVTHDWAVDALITALMDGTDTPVRVATQLARLAPRPGPRLVALLDHPDEVVRFWSARLIAVQGGPPHARIAELTHDPSPRVRAAALAALRATADPDALRSALELLADDVAPVRAHACRATAALGGVSMAGFLLPLLADGSWWVREAAQESIRGLGPAVVGFVAPGLSSPDEPVRRGVAIVLQDLGIVDSLIRTGHDRTLLERIYAAGGDDLRRAAEERVVRTPARADRSAVPAAVLG